MPDVSDSINDEDKVSLSLILGGHLQDMSPTSVENAINSLSKLAKSFSPPGTVIKMSTLREGSAIAGVAVNAGVKNEICNGIETIRREKRLPRGWSHSDTKTLCKLGKLSSHEGVTGVTLASSDSDTQIFLNEELVQSIESVMNDFPISIGSVTGQLYYYSASNSELKARLSPDNGRGFVKVEFGEELDKYVRESLRKTVELYGVLRRNPHSNEVESIYLRKLSVLEKPQTPANGLGIWKEARDQGVTVEQLVHFIRGDIDEESAGNE